MKWCKVGGLLPFKVQAAAVRAAAKKALIRSKVVLNHQLFLFFQKEKLEAF